MSQLKIHTIIYVLCLNILCSVDASTEIAEKASRTLVIAPHPDDEVICCSSALLETVSEIQQGSENSDNALVLVLTEPSRSKTTSETKNLSDSQIADLARVRREESARALEILGLPPTALHFGGFADGNLEAQLSSSENKATEWLKHHISTFKPEVIFFPHYEDRHKDHRAAYWLVRRSLAQLANLSPQPRLLSYLVHDPKQDVPELSDRIIRELSPEKKELKVRALSAYRSQTKLLKDLGIAQRAEKPEEIFYALPFSRQAFLSAHHGAWLETSSLMFDLGYNVNMGIVADLSSSVSGGSDFNMTSRSYSSDSKVVTDLSRVAIEASWAAGVIPVLKHFPGLGRATADTHRRLATIAATEDELLERDIQPFATLINEKARNPNLHFWIMTNHSIYPAFDDKPASISPAIIKDVLRNRLGYSGIVISDELSVMQSLREYAARQRLSKASGFAPILTLQAFQSGTDLVVLYFRHDEIYDRLNSIAQFVEDALQRGDWKVNELDESVARILKEKELLYGIELEKMLPELSVREKIFQKVVTDNSTSPGKLAKFGVGGIHYRQSFSKKAIVEQFKIPPFLIGQHEGGAVQDVQLGSRKDSSFVRDSARQVGKRYKALLDLETLKTADIEETLLKTEPLTSPATPAELSQLGERFSGYEAQRRARILSLARQALRYPPWMSRIGKKITRNNLSPTLHGPFALGPDSKLYLRARNSLPFDWVKTFQNEEELADVYDLLAITYRHSITAPTQLPLGWEMWGDTAIESFQTLEGHLCQLAPKLGFEPSPAHVLLVAAHPDDEDGELILYLKERFGSRVSVLFTTRGEGGKNFFDNRFGAPLAVLRMQETKSAMQELGINNFYFLNAHDFGYSSSLEEVWSHWNRKALVDALQYYVRTIGPDLIITPHTKDDPHSQHRATLEILNDALKKPLDESSPYKQQLKIKNADNKWHIPLFWRRISASEDDEAMPVWTVNPCRELAKSWVETKETALRSLEKHQSQGVGKARRYFLSRESQNQGAKQQDSCAKSYAASVAADKNVGDPLQVLSAGRSCGEILPFVPESSIPGVITLPWGSYGLITAGRSSTELALGLIGITPLVLDEAALINQSASTIDAIIIDRLALSHLAWLPKYTDQLLRLTHQGARLIVLTQHEFGPPVLGPLLPGLGGNFLMQSEIVNILECAAANPGPAPELSIPTELDIKLLAKDIGPVGEQVLEIRDNSDWSPVLSCDKAGYHQSLATKRTYGAGLIVYLSMDIEVALQQGNVEAYRLLANLISSRW